MKAPTMISGAIGAFALPHFSAAADSPSTGSFGVSSVGELSKINRVDFRENLIPDPHENQLIFAVENFSFHGDGDTLNRYLKRIAKLPDFFTVTICLTGPQGVQFLEPLTPESAQSGTGFDWQVQTVNSTNVNIIVPLAANIPFSAISIPSNVRVETESGAPNIAANFAKLHNAKLPI